MSMLISIGTWCLGNWKLLAVAGALAALFGYGHHLGEESVQADWDKAKVEAQAAQQHADEQAALTANHAALRYEEQKAAMVPRIVTITKEVSRAIESSPDWSREPVPDSVRSAIAAAGQAFAASQPDGAVQLPAAGGVEQRADGPGLRVGPAKPGGLLGAAP